MSITVRRASVQDAAADAGFMGDPGVFPRLMQMPYTNEDFRRARMTEGSEADSTAPALMAELDCALVGTSGVYLGGASQRRSHAATLGISVPTKAHDRGAASALMAALSGCADSRVGALLLKLSIYNDNMRVIGLYPKFGFFIEGTT